MIGEKKNRWRNRKKQIRNRKYQHQDVKVVHSSIKYCLKLRSESICIWSYCWSLSILVLSGINLPELWVNFITGITITKSLMKLAFINCTTSTSDTQPSKHRNIEPPILCFFPRKMFWDCERRHRGSAVHSVMATDTDCGGDNWKSIFHSTTRSLH